MKLIVFIILSIITISSSIPVETSDNYVTVVKSLNVPEDSASLIFVDESSGSNKRSKFYDGYPATNTQFPWAGTMTVWRPNIGGIIFGSSLISERWVLGARSSVAGVVIDKVEVRMGSATYFDRLSFFTDLLIWQDSPTGTNHPDIALFRLSQNVPISPYINYVRLPARSQQDLTFEGYLMTGVGFGIQNDLYTLNWAQFLVQSTSTCNNVSTTEICSRQPLGSNIVSFGSPNSGGPSVIYENGIPTLIGINIGALFNGTVETGMKSTRVGAFLNFISTNTGIPIRN